MKESEDFFDAFQKFGDSFTFDSTLFSILELLICQMYGIRCSNTNEARYLKFTSSKKTPDPQTLPPTRDSLLCHCKRVSYVTAVVKRSLQPIVAYPGPDGNGWQLSDEVLEVQ